MAYQLVWPVEARSGPQRPAYDDPPGSGSLWQQRGAVPGWPFTILVYNDGSVQQRHNPLLTDTDELADIHSVLYGGHDIRVEQGSFVYNALSNAGFELREV
jgi:hypothetical protein